MTYFHLSSFCKQLWVFKPLRFLFKNNNISIKSLIIYCNLPQMLWRVNWTLKIPWPVMYTDTTRTILGEFSELQYSLSSSYQAGFLLNNNFKRSLICLLQNFYFSCVQRKSFFNYLFHYPSSYSIYTRIPHIMHYIPHIWRFHSSV